MLRPEHNIFKFRPTEDENSRQNKKLQHKQGTKIASKISCNMWRRRDVCRIVGSVSDDGDVVIIIGVRVLPNWPGLVVCACVEMVCATGVGGKSGSVGKTHWLIHNRNVGCAARPPTRSFQQDDVFFCRKRREKLRTSDYASVWDDAIFRLLAQFNWFLWVGNCNGNMIMKCAVELWRIVLTLESCALRWRSRGLRLVQ